MKINSIYKKISLIFIIGFIVQFILVIIFYRQVIQNKIIAEVYNQSTNRSTIMQEIATDFQKYPNRPAKIQQTIDKYSKNNKVFITITDLEDTVLYSSTTKSVNKNNIKEQVFIKLGARKSFIINGEFPPKINLIKNADKTITTRRVLILIIFTVSLVTCILIYKILANPIKKISKAIKSIDYGNTLIEIPYDKEDELGLLCRNFEDMGKRLKKSEETQQDLIQAMSHDVKTPLTSIIGYSKRLLEGKVKEDKQNEYYDTIYRKANDLKQLLTELEDYSNVNSGIKYDTVKVNCNNYLNELCTNLKPEILEKKCSFEFITEVEASTNINIDVYKLNRVFNNLIQNSIKYAGESCLIQIKCSEDKDYVKFEVTDSGEGVPENELQRIFDKFHRIDTSRSRETGGTGLGLAICKDIVNHMGGKISAKNLKDYGFSIIFIIPISL
ncbi:MAG: HAMP domain-containing histidine kinase [Clostridiaceae bacterium]|nr:HAMP domain-containing histidine kinase [Clostridiaceae bacterium]